MRCSSPWRSGRYPSGQRARACRAVRTPGGIPVVVVLSVVPLPRQPWPDARRIVGDFAGPVNRCRAASRARAGRGYHPDVFISMDPGMRMVRSSGAATARVR